MSNDKVFKLASRHPLWTALARRGYEATFRLEKAGVITTEKASRLRERCLIVWDDEHLQYVNVVENTPLTEESNALYQASVKSWLKIIDNNEHPELAKQFWENYNDLPQIEFFRMAYPNPDFSRVVIRVYGEPGDSGIHACHDGKITIACQPNLHTLSSLLVWSQIKILGFGGFPVFFGDQLTNYCVGLVTQEEIAGFQSFDNYIFHLLWHLPTSPQPENLKVAKAFLAEDFNQLLDLLDQVNPLITDALIFSSGIESGFTDTDTGIGLETINAILDQELTDGRQLRSLP